MGLETTQGSDAAHPRGAARAWRRPEPWHLLLLLLATTAHWLPRLRGPLDLRYDGGVYYILGTALAQGDGYRLLSEPGEIRAVQYPPLLPAVIALHQLFLGSKDPLEVGHALRVSSFLLSLLYAVLVYALARRWLGPWRGLLAGLLTTLYFHTLFLEDLCFTEVPFAVVTVAFFLAAGAADRRARAAAPLLASAAFLLRTAGVAVLVAWAATPLLRRRWGSFARRALWSAACVLLWQGYVRSVTSSADYREPAYEYQRAPYQFYNVTYADNVLLLDPFEPESGRVTPAAFVRRVAINLPRMLVGLGESVSTTRGFWEWPIRFAGNKLGFWIPVRPVLAPLALIGAVVLLGVVQLARRGRVEAALYVVCSLALIALLPWPAQVPRYLAPLVPFLAIALCGVLPTAPGRRRAASLSAAAFLVGLQVFAARKAFQLYHHAFDFPAGQGRTVPGSLFLFGDAQEWRAFYAGLEWLRENTPADALVASTCPHLVWLHTGRKAVLPPFEPDPALAQRLLDGVPVDYAVVDGLDFLDVSRRYASPALAGRPDLWEEVLRDPEGSLTIYRRRRAF